MTAAKIAPLTSAIRAGVHRPLSALMETLAGWRMRARGRRQLMMLDDRGLADIGISRADAEAEWRKHPWHD
jgi:uncharacterized protein YjiS (DUF1127 family)